jgi:hypothetical protein
MLPRAPLYSFILYYKETLSQNLQTFEVPYEGKGKVFPVFHELSTTPRRLTVGHAYIENFLIGRGGGGF